MVKLSLAGSQFARAPSIQFIHLSASVPTGCKVFPNFLLYKVTANHELNINKLLPSFGGSIRNGIMNNKSNTFFGKVTQSITRRAAFKLISAGLLGIAVLVGTLCVTGFGTKYYRLGGGWVGGNPTYTWSVLFAPSDPLGQTAAARPILRGVLRAVFLA